jgi:PAS domain S-box-containing protein
MTSALMRGVACRAKFFCQVERLFFCCLFIALLSGVAPPANADSQPVVSVSTQQEHISLSASAWVFRDLGREIRLVDLIGPQGDALFGAGTLDVGHQEAAFWVRLKLQSSAQIDTRWWLDTGNHYLPEIVVYATDAQGRYQAQSAGGSRPFSDRPLPTPHFVYPIELPAGKPIDVYVKATTRGILNHTLNFRLWQPEAHKAHNRLVEVQWFLFLGIAAGLALFNLSLYFSLRDTSYLLFVGTVLAQVWRTSDNGLAFEYFWPDAPFFEQVISRGLSLIAVLVFTNLFVSRFIELHKLRPAMYRRLHGVTLAISALILLSMSSVYTSSFVPPGVFRFLQQLFVAGLVLYVLYMLGLLARWTWQGNRKARSILFAFSPVLILTGLIVPLLALWQIDFNWTIPPMMIGAALEMILMSLALADRLNEATLAKEQAQIALVDGLHRKERELELRVEQRTQDLAHANEAFQGILENAHDGIVLTHQRGQITHWNRQAELTFGWSRDSVLGRDFTSIVFGSGSVPIPVTNLLSQNPNNDPPETSRIETTAVRQDGTKFPLELSATSIHVNDQPEFGFFLRDITQRRKAEEEIRASLARQRELVDLKSSFVTMASHEFRTPLTTILSSTELLRFYGDRMPQQERENLHLSVESSVQRMTRMLDDVLLIGKSDAGMLECHPEPTDVRAFCASLVDEVSAATDSEKKILPPIHLRIASDVGWAAFDPKLLRHIFSNLLSNAIKYSPNGGTVEFDVAVQGSSLEFSVVDHGIGIPPEELNGLFESFFRASNAAEISGTGLGLAIVKRSVELHGGTITVSSVLSQGSRFVVLLPVLN